MKIHTSKRLTAGVASVVLVGGLLGAPAAFAATATPDAQAMPAAQFASVTGNGTCFAKDTAPAIYSGQFNAKIQMTELLKPYEAEVKKQADAGGFPWDKETVSTSASFTYTVTFPAGAEVGAATASETSSMIAKVTEDSVSPDGLTHTFKFKLNDVNWKEIYDGYTADTAAPAAHTVNITIPYTVTANSPEDAAKFAHENVTAGGNFQFYPSGRMGRFGIGLQTFNYGHFHRFGGLRYCRSSVHEAC